MLKSRPLNEDSLVLKIPSIIYQSLQNTHKFLIILALHCLIANLTGHYVNEPEKNCPNVFNKEHWGGGK